MSVLTSCPHCAAVVAAHADRCQRCQTPLSPSTDQTVMAGDPDDAMRMPPPDPDDRTRMAPRRLPDPDLTAPNESASRPGSQSRPMATSSTGWLSTSGAIDHGRFAPGTILGGRYRIVQRLGKGGMGEVFRADDLKLGQQVALKFLPADVDRDPARLTQLHTEVRLARQISHPNVCRVYDIDEVDGSTFLSMEYVDGEDLASLLRRIGRFAEDRGLEIARQICAGLAAAHERDVVHRDLKPANVMLDGAGKVRIADFGLAGASGEAIRAGTPAYMAPEQLAGQEVTARSDVYSLGLVLYEIFTGQRALDGKNLAELIHKREQSGIQPPTAIVPSLDPRIEAAIMRCLRPDPNERPASALAAAAALPGGDPLAAALAAGETPSPEMVAAAGTSDALSPAIGLSFIALIIIGLVTYATLSDRRLLYAQVPMQRSLDSLQDRALEIARAAGYGDQLADSARGLFVNFDVLRYIGSADRSATRWDGLKDRRFPVMMFWHRSSPRPLVAVSTNWAPGLTDPPLAVPGMTTMTLDDAGRLLEFSAVPPLRDAVPAPPRPSDWPGLFSAAGLSFTQFTAVEPEWVPRVYADTRAAWEGPLRDGSPIRMRVEAAAYRGAPVFFKVTGPWTPLPQSGAVERATQNPWRLLANVLLAVMTAATVLLARRNLRAGRGDLRGALRVSLAMLAVWTVAWALASRHYQSFDLEAAQFGAALAYALLNTSTLCLLYVAIEPYVRRLAPHVLISWTRLISGGGIDARVGRDILIGVTVGVGVALLGLSASLLPTLLGNAPTMPRTSSVQFLMDSRIVAGTVLRMVPNALNNAMAVTVMFAIAGAALRRVWAGAICAGLVLGIAIMGESSGEGLIGLLILNAIFVVPLIFVLIRFGLLSLAVAFLVNQVINNAPVTLDWSRPYADGAIWSLMMVAGLTAFGFYASRQGQPLLGKLLDTD